MLLMYACRMVIAIYVYMCIGILKKLLHKAIYEYNTHEGVMLFPGTFMEQIGVSIVMGVPPNGLFISWKILK